MKFETWAESVFDHLTSHYGKDFEISYNLELGDMAVPVVFSRRNRQPKSYFGIPIKNAPPGPEACEFVFMLREREFNEDTLAFVRELILRAENEYVSPGKDHGFTFISVVILCENLDNKTRKTLKNFNLYKKYPSDGGWFLARIVVASQNGILSCNKDGTDFRNLLKKNVFSKLS